MKKFTDRDWIVFDDMHSRMVRGKVGYVDGFDNEVVIADANCWLEESKYNAALIACAPALYDAVESLTRELKAMIDKENKRIAQYGIFSEFSQPEMIDEQSIFEAMQLLEKARGE